MRVFISSAAALVLAFALSAGPTAQGAPPSAPQGGQGMPPQGGMAPQGGRGRQMGGGPDPARVIPGGGVPVPGWTGKIDAAEEKNGQVEQPKLSQEGKALDADRAGDHLLESGEQGGRQYGEGDIHRTQRI